MKEDNSKLDEETIGAEFTGAKSPIDEAHLKGPEPWDQPVNGAALLDELEAGFRRFLVLPDPALAAIALWAAHAHCHDAAEESPLLKLEGPTKRCGKTTALKALRRVVPRPLGASSLTASTVYRAIEAARPTLLIDEADSFLARDKDLRGVLDSGHSREFAKVLRNVPVSGGYETREFSTWTPAAVAAIGKLPGTIEDRTIPIRLKRKRRDEKVERATRTALAPLDAINRKAARWAADHMDRLRSAAPSIPEALDDRAADNWRPLLAIADRAGGEWPERAHAAALALSGERDEADDIAILLLADLHDLFDSRHADKLASNDICAELAKLEGRPWAEYGRQRKPLTANQLARLLARFGIAPHTIRLSDLETPKGYNRQNLVDAFERYPVASNRHNASTQRGVRGNDDFQNATAGPCGRSEKWVNPLGESECGGVADRDGMLCPLGHMSEGDDEGEL